MTDTHAAVAAQEFRGDALGRVSSMPGFAWWFLAVFAVTQIPLYVLRYPDITDFANHLARLHVSMTLGSSETLQSFYELRPVRFGTNLAMDLVVPRLAPWL